ncbi:hypothetical protein A2757_01455 [Candidatus Giovannonibacteria bacterium RIFCSPHIGHO2_01_FULL_48_47]|nr:MAG: hypothetical protein A2757_01455 [Candidatus Giovannonibacteria bacterium RIFCSPHIGHO2_01_FULL_48_47]OGF68392.1 MAG: hypothetical protein A3D61_00745 [Candidatus Giovannonibacteria bacterium RIFCSPHIGHO2_02_FULL_48_15]OGF89695.1 MAG: hypothetical protein A3B26_01580 [Candidatus Giovannonibacteria bacterium RIFCSPLOWO2_01_FULL_48_47]OGF96153.1 MAG: hypothetical protein A2613_01110 [Candidatus Giovannonibacteria bacterium RIFOXYD1_FULL_48_21]HBT81323.1 hypothetical protein [Candidatus Gio
MKQLKGRNILVTGGAGFLGSNLTHSLLGKGAKVICFDDLSTGKIKNIKEFLGQGNFKFIKGNANNYRELQKAFLKNKIDYVFHYAARVGVLRTVERPLEVLEDILGIRNILDLALKNKIKKALFSSSSEVYGEPLNLPEREDGHLGAKFPYATVKLLGEHYFQAYWKTFGMPTSAVRIFNVYGPKQESSSYGFVVGIFIRQALGGKPLSVFGDGKQTRDFVYVEDNINAVIRALLSDRTNGESVNIGADRPVTIKELAQKIIRISGSKKSKIKFVPLRKGGEIRHRFPDMTKMKKLIGFRPEHSLEEGLKKTFLWYKSNL